jgi:hypothetical protein
LDGAGVAGGRAARARAARRGAPGSGPLTELVTLPLATGAKALALACPSTLFPAVMAVETSRAAGAGALAWAGVDGARGAGDDAPPRASEMNTPRAASATPIAAANPHRFGAGGGAGGAANASVAVRGPAGRRAWSSAR